MRTLRRPHIFFSSLLLTDQEFLEQSDQALALGSASAGASSGRTGCSGTGSGGTGRMEEPQTIFDAVEKFFGK